MARRGLVRIHLKKGELGKHGYKDVKLLTVAQRRAALRSAAAEFGWSTVQKKLNVLYVYNKYRHPETAALFWADAAWASQQRKR